jgi:hypothetical protein
MIPHNSDAGLPDGKGLPEPAMREINPYLGNGDPYGGKTHLEWFTAAQMEAYATARVAASQAERDSARARAASHQADGAAWWKLADERAVEIARLREALAELIACKDLKDAMLTVRSDPYYITQADRMESQYDQRKPVAWERARAALNPPPAAGDSAVKGAL